MMNDYMLDAPDYEDYEAEQERIERLHKRLAAQYEREERKREEERDAEN